jgi:chromosomal replication initiator protein
LELSAHHEKNAAWRDIRAGLRSALGESMYAVWIEPLELAEIRDGAVVLRANAQTQAWLRKRYGRVLERCIAGVLGGEPTARFRFVGEDPPNDPAPRTGRGGGEAGSRVLELERLNPRYTFDQFIIGDGNQLAHAAALVVAELPGQTYNPLFLHAPPGLGKTHLLHAIGNYVLTYGGGARVRYTTVEAFTNHFIRAIGTKSVDRFKQAYRDVDVLLIDDVQFLASKAKTEEEFFHTFNALYETGRQLVLTCDRLPSQLTGIEERLRERFAAGLVADIEPPDLTTRVGILRKRTLLDGVPPLADGVLELIAERVTDNVRTLEGALIRVVAYHSLIGGEAQGAIDLELTQKVLDGMHYPHPAVAGSSRATAKPTAQALSIDAVQVAVADHYGLSVDELISPTRAVRVAWPRQLAIHLARELTGAPLTVIGSAFGGRNHATVLHACKRVAERVAQDQQAAVDIAELSRRLKRPSS